MTATLAGLPAFLQDLFAHHPEDLDARARSGGDPAAAPFCRRRRAVTPASFVRTLVFGWLDNPTAGVSGLAECACCLGPAVGESGLRQHFNSRGVGLLREVLDHALQPLLFGRRGPPPL